MNFSARVTDNGCSLSELTEEDKDNLQSELAKVIQQYYWHPRFLHYSKNFFNQTIFFLAKIEDEMHTLRQVLLAKEKNAADIRRQLGLSPLGNIKQNLSKGWQEVQTSAP